MHPLVSPRFFWSRLPLAALTQFCLLIPFTGWSQDELQLKPNDNLTSVNTLSFTINPKKLREIHAAKGEKISIDVNEIVVNNVALPAEHFRIRGSSSSQYYRKSYNIQLLKKAKFSGRDTFSTKNIYAISLSMDRNYVRNKIAYSILNTQNIYVPPHTYSTVFANSNSEGIYMLFYPPADYASKERNSPFVIRRGYDSSVKKTYDKKISPEEAKALTQQFNSIYKKLIPRLKGEELLAALKGVMDLDGYFTWMAFNHLFQNGDYSDEVYFMWNTERKRFELIPWDFDDLFQMTPHEESSSAGKKRYVFSVEDKLDAAIANDPVLYLDYLKAYKRFLDNFDTAKFKRILEETYWEVYPYFMSPETIAQSRYDKYMETNIQNLQKDLNSIYLNISLRMVVIKRELSTIK